MAVDGKWTYSSFGVGDFLFCEEDSSIWFCAINGTWMEKGNALQGLTGGISGKSAYEIAVANGYVGSETDWLSSLEGKSAYQIAVDLGFSGTEQEWLLSLKDQNGRQVELQVQGSILQWKYSDQDNSSWVNLVSLGSSDPQVIVSQGEPTDQNCIVWLQPI